MLRICLFDDESGETTDLGLLGDFAETISHTVCGNFVNAFADSIGSVTTVLTAAQFKARVNQAYPEIGKQLYDRVTGTVHSMAQNARDNRRK